MNREIRRRVNTYTIGIDIIIIGVSLPVGVVEDGCWEGIRGVRGCRWHGATKLPCGGLAVVAVMCSPTEGEKASPYIPAEGWTCWNNTLSSNIVCDATWLVHNWRSLDTPRRVVHMRTRVGIIHQKPRRESFPGSERDEACSRGG